jgi:selenocysteine lyase/cysteine desulfurase
MKQNRRSFLKKAVLSTATIGMGSWLTSAGRHHGSNTPIEKGKNDWKSSFMLSDQMVYMNNGTMGVSPESVLDQTITAMRLADTMGKYGGGEEELCQSLARFLGGAPSSYALTRNVTEGTNMVLMGLKFKKGDEIVCTSHEHAGTAIPLMYRSRKDGIVLKVVDIHPNPMQTTDHILSAITKKTRLLCLPHMPCTTGQLLEVAYICREARKRNILTFIDGAHPPGMLKVDIPSIGCDFYSGCGHKWMLGPKGTGFLYVHPPAAALLPPVFVGAGTYGAYLLNTQTQSYSKPATDGHKYYYGSQNAGLFLGLAASVSFLMDELGMEQVESHAKRLSLMVRDSVKHIHEEAVFLCPDDMRYRTGVCSFRIPGMSSETICQQMRQKGIIVRHVHENNLDLVRVSTHVYNTEEDVFRFSETLKDMM